MGPKGMGEPGHTITIRLPAGDEPAELVSTRPGGASTPPVYYPNGYVTITWWTSEERRSRRLCECERMKYTLTTKCDVCGGVCGITHT